MDGGQALTPPTTVVGPPEVRLGQRGSALILSRDTISHRNPTPHFVAQKGMDSMYGSYKTVLNSSESRQDLIIISSYEFVAFCLEKIY